MDLAGYSSPQLRRRVSADPRAPSSGVVAFGSDRDWRTRAAVGTRPDVPNEAATSLAESSGELIAGYRTPTVVGVVSRSLRLVCDRCV